MCNINYKINKSFSVKIGFNYSIIEVKLNSLSWVYKHSLFCAVYVGEMYQTS